MTEPTMVERAARAMADELWAEAERNHEGVAWLHQDLMAKLARAAIATIPCPPFVDNDLWDAWIDAALAPAAEGTGTGEMG